MSVVLHQIAKDLRCVRLPLLAWLALLLVSTAWRLVGLDLLLYPGEWTTTSLRLLAPLDPAVTVLGWFLTVRIVHADPVDGTTAFWLTRPVSRRTLWASKLLLVTALFVLLPAATTALVVASVADTAAVLQAVAERALFDSAFVLAAIWLAALTRDVARLVIAGVAAWIAASFVHILFFAAEMLWTEPEAALVRSSGVLVAGLGFSVGMLGVGRFLYLTRRRAPALAAGAVLVLAAAVLTVAWPWNVMSSPWRPAAPPLDPDRVSLAIERPSPVRNRAPAGTSYIEAWLRVSGMPDGWAALPVRFSSTLRLPDGTLRRHDEPERDFISNEYAPLSRWASDGVSDLVGVRPAGAPPTAGRGLGPWTTLAVPAAAAEGTRVKGDLEATFTCIAFRGVVEATLPLIRGSQRRTADGSVSLLAARPGSGESPADVLVVDVRTVAPRLLLPSRQKDLLYVLRDKVRREWLVERPGSRRVRLSSGLAWFAPASVRYNRLEFVRQPDADMPDDEWLRRAELVILSFEAMGTFTKMVRIPGFEIPPVAARTQGTAAGTTRN